MIRGAKIFSYFYIGLAFALITASCQTIDLYEKVEAIPAHQWQYGFKPSFNFTIKDTAAAYQLYLILRHNNKYAYNNIWLKLSVKGPADTLQTVNLDLPLANKEGWLTKGMDDVFEHRIAFALDPQRFAFRKPGEYSFTLEQIMRDNPLPNVMNVGLRIEKKTP